MSAFSVPVYFGLKTIVGLIMIKFSARYLGVGAFTVFSQLFILSNLLNLVAAGGVQNGLVRQAAIARDLTGVRNAHDGAVAIWVGACLLIGVPAMVLRGPLSHLLVGSPAVESAIPWVVVLCASSGPAMIYTSILAGRGRLVASMLTQAIGLLIGGGAALWFLRRGDAIDSVMSFAGGPVVTALLGWLLVRRMRLPPRAAASIIVAEVKTLLGYSGAFVVTAATSSLVLFALRAAFRARFGVQALGFWLMASRITDLNSQLTALFMLQVFLPAFSSTEDFGARRAIALRIYAVALLAMLGSLSVFLAEPSFFITTFLSKTYLGAKGAITAYLAADCFRVAFYLLLQVALSQRKLLSAIWLELATTATFALIMLIGFGPLGSNAPYIAQITTYLLVTALGVVIFLRWRRGGLGGGGIGSPEA